MNDLAPEIKQKVVELCEKAVSQSEIERFEASNRSLEKVLLLIPEPKPEWKAYTWLQASRPDNFYELEHYAEALVLFEEALELDEVYQSNGYVHMRIGQCLHHLKRQQEALGYLKEAYQLGGEELFEDEYAIYKKLAKQV